MSKGIYRKYVKIYHNGECVYSNNQIIFRYQEEPQTETMKLSAESIIERQHEFLLLHPYIVKGKWLHKNKRRTMYDGFLYSTAICTFEEDDIFQVKITYESAHDVTLKDLIHYLPADEFIEYCLDREFCATPDKSWEIR